MTQIDPQGRAVPPIAGDEMGTILGFLDYQRATLAWKCAGVDAAGLSKKVAASALTLGGLLKHMAYVEDAWFSQSLHHHDKAPPWDKIDWKTNPDWEFESAADDTPEQLIQLWQASVDRSRKLLDEVLREGSLSTLAKRTWPNGNAPSVRWILVHMIEEYARHNGHADLLRESIDGETGE